ncbi:DUF5789 family protein [Salinilacihabitans rarus]|uniref:DUF5789 family protein n=1 Tax=Salinilacihabitans rarus TaxID=2961596 RepID=UPI0020C8DF81|nr:hypothetical protein [Salinilacihabitans rarus]
MTDRHSADDRELGIEFGDLRAALEDPTYPATSEELVESCGDCTIELPGGEETFGDLLAVLPEETYESPGEARRALFNAVDSRAIGRKYYSDRTPPANGERREDDPVSF